MNQRKNTSVFLKECMGDAVIQLLGQKEFSKITVDEIVAAAGVGRATWFRHFTTKEEAVSFKLGILWRNWKADYEEANQKTITWDNSEYFFQYFYHYRGIYSKIYKAGLRNLVINDFIKSMEYSDNDKNYQFYHHQFYGFALFGLVDGWIERNYTETIPQMQEFLKEIIKNPN